ncbi:MAG: FliI/YscN family ATPase [Planctomycetes bacterium]|nr:FliI/YscN family ATPase [Planctomycetota bacterium]
MRAFDRERVALEALEPARVSGRVTRVVGLLAEAEGLSVPVGGQCVIDCRAAGRRIPAEVIGFRGDRALVTPLADLRGIAADDEIQFRGGVPSAPAGDGLIGRVLNGLGDPIDDLGPLEASERWPLYGERVSPLLRQRVAQPIGTGIRAIDGLLACGRGQRLGIFSGSGVGKSVLLGMIARNTEAEASVIALIGERGREVREFIERDLGPDGLARAVVIVATSDEPAIVRIRAAHLATAIAESFRARGGHILLLMDSATRVAMAQREVGLAAEEPPSTRGYTPSVFALLPSLLERAGAGESGSITGFYAVLVEADDIHDPTGDAVRGILDGHIWLSRDLAARGHYPAIDVLQSVSRVMPDIVAPEEYRAAREVTGWMARHREVEDLIRLGAYAAGSDPAVDEAIARMPSIEAFLKQDREERSPASEARARVVELAKPRPAGRAAAAAPRARGRG